MKIVISLLTDIKPTAINKLFAVYDTKQQKLVHMLQFNNKGLKHINNLNGGTGMCYHNQYWYAACFAREHRVGSRLLIVDTNSGKATMNKLTFTKAIHSISPYGKCGPYTMILANSTQNDCLSIITTYKTNVLTEDVFFDFLHDKERIKLNWHEEYVYDDLLHTNCVYKNNGDIYVSMFLNHLYTDNKYKMIKHWRSKKSLGIIYNLTKQQVLCEGLTQPHSIIINQFGELVFCESGSFSIVNASKNRKVKLKGFTRGLCEDKWKGGYWVGMSYHRKFNTDINGATLQFVSYDMQAEDPIDLSTLGREVYDIIEFKKGRY
jgi:hypothetical protein